MRKELRKLIAVKLIELTLYVLPECTFKSMYAEFIKHTITKL